VPIGGEHIQAIDEPIIAKVGAHMTQALNGIEHAIEAERQQDESEKVR
jgi:polyketide synthase 13